MKLSDIIKHIEVYHMRHEDSNGNVHSESKKAVLLEDLEWLENEHLKGSLTGEINEKRI